MNGSLNLLPGHSVITLTTDAGINAAQDATKNNTVIELFGEKHLIKRVMIYDLRSVCPRVAYVELVRIEEVVNHPNPQ